jgi:hypothetical protein
MVSEPFGPQVVRKYWLLAELGRALALAKMSSVEFADGDIHRQIVRWQLAPRSQSRVPAEAIVWVNRSESDWKVNNHLLPPFGFYALVHSRPSNRQSPIAHLKLPLKNCRLLMARELSLNGRYRSSLLTAMRGHKFCLAGHQFNSSALKFVGWTIGGLSWS